MQVMPFTIIVKTIKHGVFVPHQQSFQGCADKEQLKWPLENICTQSSGSPDASVSQDVSRESCTESVYITSALKDAGWDPNAAVRIVVVLGRLSTFDM